MKSILQNKTLAYTIIFLLVANLALLAYFAFFKSNKDTRTNRKPISDFVDKTLGFTEQQKKTWEQMRSDSKNKMKKVFEESADAKDSLFQLVPSPNLDDSLVYDKALAIGEKQRAIELEMFRQYRSLYEMCTAEQKAKFDTGFMNAVKKTYRRRSTPDSTKKAKP